MTTTKVSISRAGTIDYDPEHVGSWQYDRTPAELAWWPDEPTPVWWPADATMVSFHEADGSLRWVDAKHDPNWLWRDEMSDYLDKVRRGVRMT